MRNVLFLTLVLALCGICSSFQNPTPKTIHVYVALCDNVNQGIVPVPAQLGNGTDARNNLYWGALYGVKTFLKRKDSQWQLVKTLESDNPVVLEKVLFKHKTQNCYLLAEAYKGAQIKNCMEDFFTACSGGGTSTLTWNQQTLSFAGASSLLAYVGHDGLMDFGITKTFSPANSKSRKAIMLACYSKSYFTSHLKKSGAQPLIWTTGLMAPEAYTLEAATNAWLAGKEDAEVRQSAAEAYHKYQKCGINGAKRLLVTGW